ncbi:MAG: NIPSNAP family protein [Planctomycetota bacterium]
MRLFTLLAAIASALTSTSVKADETNQDGGDQMYEVRRYVLSDVKEFGAVSNYLTQALLPALNKAGASPIGLMTNVNDDGSLADKTEEPTLLVIIPINDAGTLATLNSTVSKDPEYLESAASYLATPGKSPLTRRIESELLVAMECMPKLSVPSGTVENLDRVYELRLYESATENLGNLKVEMFNNGEVPIFLDCGIIPIFIGQAVVGGQTPSLTYLTVYPNDEARKEAWKQFRVHPDWKVLSKEPKYAGTVSKIDKYILRPLAGSQM